MNLPLPVLWKGVGSEGYKRICGIFKYDIWQGRGMDFSIITFIAALASIFLTTYLTNKLVGDYQREWLEKKYGKKLPKRFGGNNFGIPFTKVGFIVFILILSISLTVFDWIIQFIVRIAS